MDISLTLTDAQQKGLEYVTNLANKSKADSDKITPDQYATNALVAALNSYAAQRSSVRTQYGLSLYANADPALKAEIDSKLGFADEFPTGNE
jgi:hypothetical protein